MSCPAGSKECSFERRNAVEALLNAITMASDLRSQVRYTQPDQDELFEIVKDALPGPDGYENVARRVSAAVSEFLVTYYAALADEVDLVHRAQVGHPRAEADR